MIAVVRGLPELNVKLALLPTLSTLAAEAGRAQGAVQLAAAAQQNAPVLTGHMAESIEPVDEGAGVGVGAPYSPFVEGGTLYMTAQPFLGPAFETMSDTVVADIAQSVRAALMRL